MLAKDEFVKIEEMVLALSKRLSSLRCIETDAYIALEDAKYNTEDAVYKKNISSIEDLRRTENTAIIAWEKAKYDAEDCAEKLAGINRLRQTCVDILASDLQDSVMASAISMVSRLFDGEMLPYDMRADDGWITIYVERLDRRASIDLGNAEEIVFSYHSILPPCTPTVWGVYNDDDVAVSSAITSIQSFIFGWETRK